MADTSRLRGVSFSLKLFASSLLAISLDNRLDFCIAGLHNGRVSIHRVLPAVRVPRLCGQCKYLRCSTHYMKQYMPVPNVLVMHDELLMNSTHYVRNR